MMNILIKIGASIGIIIFLILYFLYRYQSEYIKWERRR